MVVIEVSEKNGYQSCKFEWNTLEAAIEFAKRVLIAVNGSAHNVTISLNNEVSAEVSDKDGDEQW